jgi:hypothetical protein
MSPTDVPPLVLTNISTVVIQPRQQEFERSLSKKSENESIPHDRHENPVDQNRMNENILSRKNRYKIRRKGEVENIQGADIPQSNTSIASPIGFIGDSIKSERTPL